MSEKRLLHPGDMPELGDHPFNPWLNPYAMREQRLPYYLAQARLAARELGFSYRGFKVGAAVHAIDHLRGRQALLVAGNYKPSADVQTRCAELNVITKAQELGFDEIVALAIAGPL